MSTGKARSIYADDRAWASVKKAAKQTHGGNTTRYLLGLHWIEVSMRAQARNDKKVEAAFVAAGIASKPNC